MLDAIRRIKARRQEKQIIARRIRALESDTALAKRQAVKDAEAILAGR